ncbi:hypothetical protein X777_16214 [Ooceraea biroi]|uniref:DDE Tnp4 domain-containing protein n=1 Tax=Ooceraea biroi TaxID=2015173 RepID=A0A026VUV4_OOCBI|nr:hypothetical protein X777_16214 [Ooceraea biroi]
MLKITDKPLHFNYLRMDSTIFEELFLLVGPHLAPPHSGSVYYNYKKFHSFNLTGIADAHYRFILIDVGSEGRRSDAGVFAASSIKARLEADSLNVPAPSTIGQSVLPYVFVGDEAYPLTAYLMRL